MSLSSRVNMFKKMLGHFENPTLCGTVGNLLPTNSVPFHGRTESPIQSGTHVTHILNH
jgi:hypothetical protein